MCKKEGRILRLQKMIAMLLAVLVLFSFAGASASQLLQMSIPVTGTGDSFRFDEAAGKLIFPDCIVTDIYAEDTTWEIEGAESLDYQKLFNCVWEAQTEMLPENPLDGPWDLSDNPQKYDKYLHFLSADLILWLQSADNPAFSARILMSPSNAEDFPEDGYYVYADIRVWKNNQAVEDAYFEYLLESENLWNWVVAVGGGNDEDISQIAETKEIVRYLITGSGTADPSEISMHITDSEIIDGLVDAILAGESMGNHRIASEETQHLRFYLADGNSMDIYLGLTRIPEEEDVVYARLGRSYYRLDRDGIESLLKKLGLESIFDYY